ncbi:MAG: thioesterase domain-containing protein [Rhodocyclales bacterium]|nr:thioesterase domain-containing protein [Rhodocyclales bacterium]
MDRPTIDARSGARSGEQKLQALFVHGMGRSPLSGWPLLWRLKRAGLKTSTFGYAVTISDFSEIVDRLVSRMEQLARQGDYILIGHSLGGVLLRAATAKLQPETHAPQRLFLLGSPIQSARLALRLRFNPIFRALTRDCGQLLGSGRRMREIESTDIPVTAVTGVRGAPEKFGLFGHEPNDGIVSASETSAEWIRDTVELPVVHTLLPSSPRVADTILERLKSPAPALG